MIGLDLGSKFIKACTIVPKSEMNYIVYSAMTTVPKEEKRDNIEFNNKIKNLLRQIRFKDKEVTLSIGDIDLLARDFVMPKVSEENFHNAVMLEAESSIFEEIDDMYSDFHVLSETPDGKSDVLFVAYPQKKYINHTIDKLSSIDISVAKVTVDNLALANAFRVFADSSFLSKTVVLVNIGHEVSNIAILDNGILRFIRNVAFGGKDITQEIANLYDVDFEVAEKIKRQPEIWDQIGLNIKNVLKKSSSNLLEAIFRSMEYCVSRQKIGKIDNVLITGGGAILKGMDTFIFEVLGISASKWNPLESDKISSITNPEKGYFSAVALGLALEKEFTNV